MKQITEACGCCEGIEIVTPQPTANRPGLSALSYRVGTHATFLETMLARLSSSDYPKLAELRTRETDDPSIALLDAWAIVADVLTFYNERIINEDYLRTATERRSILELARLVGYKLRPGVASSVYLAYTLTDTPKDEAIIIPKGARSQSIPGPGELPQSFETSEDLKARAKWNNLKPRLTRPQTKESIELGDGANQQIYLKGISTNLKPGEPILIGFGKLPPQLYWIKSVAPEAISNRTCIVLTKNAVISNGQASAVRSTDDQVPLGLIGSLVQSPTPQFANSQTLPRVLTDQFIRSSQIPTDTSKLGETGINTLRSTSSTGKTSTEKALLDTIASGDASYEVMKAFAPILQGTLSTAVANAKVTPDVEIKVYALRVKAAPFGHNAPLRPIRLNPDTQVMEYSEWATENPGNKGAPSVLFIVDHQRGDAPLTVKFENKSTGFIEKISWFINDVFWTGEWSPTRIFELENGVETTYTIKLTVSGSGGKTSHSTTITVTQPVIIN